MIKKKAIAAPVDGLLRQRLKDVVSAVEALMRTTAEQTNAEYRSARAALDATMAAAKSHIADDVHGVVVGAKEIGDRSTRLVRSNPWMAVGIGSAAGLVVGLLLRRR